MDATLESILEHETLGLGHLNIDDNESSTSSDISDEATYYSRDTGLRFCRHGCIIGEEPKTNRNDVERSRPKANGTAEENNESDGETSASARHERIEELRTICKKHLENIRYLNEVFELLFILVLDKNDKDAVHHTEQFLEHYPGDAIDRFVRCKPDPMNLEDVD